MKSKKVEISERTMRYYNRSITKSNKTYIDLFKLHNKLRKQLKNMTENAYYFSNYNNYYYAQYNTLLHKYNENESNKEVTNENESNKEVTNENDESYNDNSWF